MKHVNVVIGALASAIIVIIFGVAPRAAATSVAGDPVNGQKVFTAQKCEMCHNGKITVELKSIGSKRDAAWLAKYLVAPTVLDPKNPPKIKMVAVKVKGKELDDLIAYLVTLKGK